MDKKKKTLLMSSKKILPSVLILSDIFTDTSGTSLDAHTIAPTNVPAVSWVEEAGSAWKIYTGNIATLEVGGDNQIATVDSGIADCIIVANVVAASSNNTYARDVGIVLRYVDALNYWCVTINPILGAVRLVEVNGGTFSTRASSAMTITSGTSYLLNVQAKGSTISATVDGANNILYASAELNKTVTKHGIKARAVNVDYFNDIAIYTNP